MMEQQAPSFPSEANGLSGRSFLAGVSAGPGRSTFHSSNPDTGDSLLPEFHIASPEDVREAARLAAEAAIHLRRSSGSMRGLLLRSIANEIESGAEVIVARARQETALPEPRLRSELARTTAQLRMFAALIEEGSWVDARIDPADAARVPLPKPDVRSVYRAIGPVAVFCASNFPLAFSVAGGDTASAFAAGCPVIVVAHPAHPGTAELVALAIQRALRATELPPGAFSLLQGPGEIVGVELLRRSEMRACGFTGSRRGGLALARVAADRPDPIPMFAEMSSVNPVFLLPEALASRMGAIVEGLAASITLGVGQFCTNPGLVFVPAGETGTRFAELLVTKLGDVPPGTMLRPEIRMAYRNAIAKRASGFLKEGDESPALALNSGSHPRRLETLLVPSGEQGPGGRSAAPALFRTNVDTFVAHPTLAEEIFGPETLLVEYGDPGELIAVVRQLEGQLTGTLHGTPEELQRCRDLIDALEDRVGRIVVNAFPTGVEVCSAMVHGGPAPATTDGRSTSVGTRAIFRFVRPVCFQGMPEELLPEAIMTSNPLGIARMVNGRRESGGNA